MKYFTKNRSLQTTTIKSIIGLISFALVSVFGFLLGSSYNEANSKIHLIFSSDIKLDPRSSTNNQQSIKSSSREYNSTHLWSMRLANEDYFRLARLLPCRIVEYVGGPNVNKIDSCDHSSTNEFSIQNTLQAQKWLYEHQHPMDCTNKRFAIIENFAWSGFGSTVHQIVWAFGTAIADNRIAVYQTPGNWLYGTCDLRTPDCIFLPITNCSILSKVDSNQTIKINANTGHWSKPIHPSIFQNRTFNWYRAQLLFYLMRYKPETLTHVQNTIANYFKPPSIDLHHPYIAVYVRRSDKVRNREMSQAYTLKQYFDLFDTDVRRVNISTVYINSEDEQVFDEFFQINKEKQGYYKLLNITAERNVVFASLVHMTNEQRRKIVLEFLSDLFIEANADLHVGTLSSNWCRLVDEMRLVLGKTIPFYTPEQRFLMDMRR
ncbi:unnamed protein product [Rotaria sordida]|uniref:Alpha-(1,6)-fucosyltransferase N- and catalytic domain-containing protein n=1 Tax=Rotaria sordida TaxID=392033 RepID=A0A814EEB5_9BILA|nr:unnamed protein product [Rotaria sordida]CAF3771351.1 unnamed protein product [Rotaria sordida]